MWNKLRVRLSDDGADKMKSSKKNGKEGTDEKHLGETFDGAL